MNDVKGTDFAGKAEIHWDNVYYWGKGGISSWATRLPLLTHIGISALVSAAY